MNLFKIVPYKMTSVTSKRLSQGLGCLRVKADSNTYRPRSNHVIINWGNSHDPSWILSPYIRHIKNLPWNVAIAANKLSTFQALKEVNVPTPEWTTERIVANQWIEDGSIVFAREILTGNSGAGIVLMDDVRTLVNAPLYTKYTKCKHEFRVHVMNGAVIDFAQKKKRTDITAEQQQYFNPHIRSHGFGWIFAREGVELPNKVKEAALAAISALGLDFGAVDIGYKVNEDKAFVYEVNTAPGLEGHTLETYIAKFKENYMTERNNHG